MSKQKQKGTAAETAVVKSLHRKGFHHARRNPLAGTKDVGDIGGIPGVTIEVKNHARLALSEWMNEATTEADNAGNDLGVVWHKRKGFAAPENWYVTMSGSDFLVMLDSYVEWVQGGKQLIT